MLRAKMPASGLILIDKPQGITSRKATSIVSRIFQEKKAGHLGTLDPIASGLLPILLGSATRLVPFLEADEKEYEAVIRLGTSTTTMDKEGEVIFAMEPPELSRDELEEILKRFQGEIDHLIPAFSAHKRKGKRLYELAREGKEIEPEFKKVWVYELELIDFGRDWLKIRAVVSPGTYVRSLADAIGRAIGCGGHLESLVRLRSGRFKLSDALPIDSLTPENCQQYLIPLEEVLDYEKIELDKELGYRIKDGQALLLEKVGLKDEPLGKKFRIFSPICFAIAEVVEKENKKYLKPIRVFVNI